MEAEAGVGVAMGVDAADGVAEAKGLAVGATVEPGEEVGEGAGALVRTTVAGAPLSAPEQAAAKANKSAPAANAKSLAAVTLK